MTKLEEILDKHTNAFKEDATVVYTKRALCNAMEEYAEFKLNEFKNSDRFSKLLEDSEWLYYLNCAGVDNWEGYSVAHDLKKEDSE